MWSDFYTNGTERPLWSDSSLSLKVNLWHSVEVSHPNSPVSQSELLSTQRSPLAPASLPSILWYGKRMWKRVDPCIRIAESLCGTAEITTILQINYTSIKLRKKKRSLLRTHLSSLSIHADFRISGWSTHAGKVPTVTGDRTQTGQAPSFRA